MSRISSLAVNSQLISRILKTQMNLLDFQSQVTTQQKSQTYAGISVDSQRLLNAETLRDRLTKYVNLNEQQQTRMNVASTAVESIQESITNFKKELTAYSSGTPMNEENVKQVQAAAYRALRDMEDLLNTEVDGRYIFAGSRTTTTPVDLGISSISGFQAIYDGATVKVPETRDAQLENFSYSSDKNNTNSLYIDNSKYLQFRRDGDGDSTSDGDSTIRATSALFTNLTAGATITIDDTSSNNGTYTVKSVSSDGMTVTVSTKMLTDETLGTDLTTETPAGAVTFLLESDTGGSPSKTSAGGTIDFDTTNNTITATGADVGLFSGISAGDYITVGGSGGNNKTFKVASVDGTNSVITIDTGPATMTLADKSVLDAADFGELTFSRSADTITSTVADAFSGVSAGDVITVGGTDENAGTYTVASVSSDGKTITIESTKLTDEGLSGSTFMDQFTNTDIEFIASSKTIEVRRDGTTTAVPDIFNGLSVGDKFTVTNSTNNNATFTIASIASDGSSVTVEETVTDETDTDGVNFAGSGNQFAYVSGTQLAFTDATNTIELQDSGGTAVAGAFSSLKVGQSISLTGSAYDDSYVITSIASDGSSIVVSDPNGTITADAVDTAQVRMQVFGTGGTISSTSYYQGDDLAITHRLDSDRSVEFDIQANDPAFEKAIRAMKLILQGEFGTEGGLDQNQDRIADAQYLLSSALERNVEGDPPFGDEEIGSIEQVSQDIGFDQYLIKSLNQTHTDFIGFLEQSVANIENADPLESITKLLDEQNALNASYQTFARIRQLSLTNFL